MNLAKAYVVSLALGVCAAIAISCFTGCSDGAWSDEAELGTTEEPISTAIEDGSGTFGVDVRAGLPYPRCDKNGDAAQDCRFVSAYQFGDGGFMSQPTRYMVRLLDSVGWTSPSFDATRVDDILRPMVAAMSENLRLPQLTSAVLIDYSVTRNTKTTGVNVQGGHLPGTNTTRTDTYFSAAYNLCLSDPLQEPTPVAGLYRRCSQCTVTIDYDKLSSDFPADISAGSPKLKQVLAKGVDTCLGIGRQEVVAGYPSNRNFNPQEFLATGVYFTSAEKNALQCVGFTNGTISAPFGFQVFSNPASCATRR